MRRIPAISMTLALAACAGPAGPTGPQGAAGPAGSDGDDGTNGTDGTAGADGQDGADGDDGEDASGGILMVQRGRYETGVFDESAAEIVTYDAGTTRAFVVNANAGDVDVLNVADPANITLVQTLDVSANQGSATLGAANSVDSAAGVIAVAVEADPKTDDGVVQFYDAATLAFQGQATTCALPDSVVFTPDGSKVIVACEGEPNDDYSVDPDGEIAIVDISAGAGSASVSVLGFGAFSGDQADLEEGGFRIFGPNASFTQDIEPEYVTVSADGGTAWVTLQENNGVAIVDVTAGSIEAIVPLGFKNHSIPGNELDASDRDDAVNIRTWPVWGIYNPDAIASWEVHGKTYLITANEGDARDYDTWSEEERIKDLVLDPTVFPDAAALQADEQLGRLTVTTTLGDDGDDGDYEALYAFGARSFSVWDGETGALLYDSGNLIEVITAQRHGIDFNNNNDENDPDTRSDAKGPEPEAIAVGRVGRSTYAFVGLERMGGIMAFDVTLPESPRFVQYLNNRDLGIDFDGDVPSELSAAGDLGPESIEFVPADDTPTGTPWLLVGNEVSGTTTVYEILSVP